ncbi:MAG TPA: dihydroneopterin aldolase [Caulobacteraceae bacterium]|nr:dihydroneopterin aldolase [Caulobacteraceae bacterium]
MAAPSAAPIRPAGLKVFVRGLRIAAEIGVYAHERGRAQPLAVDVDLELAPHAVERLSDTVNYETVAERACAVAEAGHVDLVEEYAERLARACLEDPRVRSVRVRVEKPEALAGAEAAGCEVRFTRD